MAYVREVLPASCSRTDRGPCRVRRDLRPTLRAGRRPVLHGSAPIFPNQRPAGRALGEHLQPESLSTQEEFLAANTGADRESARGAECLGSWPPAPPPAPLGNHRRTDRRLYTGPGPRLPRCPCRRRHGDRKEHPARPVRAAGRSAGDDQAPERLWLVLEYRASRAVLGSWPAGRGQRSQPHYALTGNQPAHRAGARLRRR